MLFLLGKEMMRRGDRIRQQGMLEQFRKEVLEELARKKKEYRIQSHAIQKEKDALYEDYAAGRMDAKEYRERADGLARQAEELSGKYQEAETEYDWIKEEMNRDKQDMKQIIRCSRLEALTQEVADAFIRKVILYKNKRVQIEWNFTE